MSASSALFAAAALLATSASFALLLQPTANSDTASAIYRNCMGDLVDWCIGGSMRGKMSRVPGATRRGGAARPVPRCRRAPDRARHRGGAVERRWIRWKHILLD